MVDRIAIRDMVKRAAKASEDGKAHIDPQTWELKIKSLGGLLLFGQLTKDEFDCLLRMKEEQARRREEEDPSRATLTACYTVADIFYREGARRLESAVKGQNANRKRTDNVRTTMRDFIALYESTHPGADDSDIADAALGEEGFRFGKDYPRHWLTSPVEKTDGNPLLTKERVLDIIREVRKE